MPVTPPLFVSSDNFDDAISTARRQLERDKLAQERAESDRRQTYLNGVNQRLPGYASQGLNPSGYKTPAIENDERRQTYDPNAPQGGPLKEKAPPDEGDLRAAVTVTEDAKPDQEAEYHRMAKAMGVTVDVVRAMGAEAVTSFRKMFDLNFFTKDTPALRRKYTREDFMRLAQDDSEKLADLEKSFRNPFLMGKLQMTQLMTQTVPEAAAGTPQALVSAAGAVGEGTSGLAETSTDLVDELFRTKPSPAMAAFLGASGEELREVVEAGDKPKDPNSFLSRTSAWLEGARKASKSFKEEMTPETDNPIVAGYYSGLQSFGASVPWIVAGVATAQPELALAGLAGQTMGEAAGRGKDAGLSPIESTLFGLREGGIEYVTEKLPMVNLVADLANKTPFGEMLLRQLATELPGEQVATFLQDANDWLTLNPGKTVGEFLAERPNAALQTAVATAVAVVLQSGGAKAIDTIKEKVEKQQKADEREEKIAAGGLDALDEILAAAASTKTLERDPVEIEKFVDELAEDGPLRNVFFRPETFSQVAQDAGMDPNELAIQLGVVDQVEASLASGAVISVPLGKFVSVVARNENAEVFRQNVLTSAVGLSREELKALPENQRERLAVQAEKVAKEVQVNEEFAAGLEHVRQNIHTQLEEVGRFTGQPNEMYALLTAHGYGALSLRLGVTPEEAFVRYPLRVAGEAVTEGSAALPQGQGPGGAGRQQARQKLMDFFNAKEGNDRLPLSRIVANTGVDANFVNTVRSEWRDATFGNRTPGGILLSATGRKVRDARLELQAADKKPETDGGGEETTLGQDKGQRGEYDPSKGQIGLLRKADLSTFLHEIGHHFLEVHVDAATKILERQRAGEEMTRGEMELLDDVQSLLEQLKVTPGAVGEGTGSYAQNGTLWALEFFETLDTNATDASVKEMHAKLFGAFDKALREKRNPMPAVPTIRLFRTSTGRIIAFNGAYTHTEARMLMGEEGKAEGDLRMDHGMYEPWNKGGLDATRWYDTTGKIKDSDTFAQLDATSFRAIRNAHPESIQEWYTNHVEEEVTSRGRVLRIKSQPDIAKPDIVISVKPSEKFDGGQRFRGASVDMTFQGKLSAVHKMKDLTPEQRVEVAKQAHVAFMKTIVALQGYVARHKPDYLVFTGSATSQSNFYEFILKNFDLGYEARIEYFSEHQVFSGAEMPAGQANVVDRIPVFTLVKPDIAHELALELSNVEIDQTEFLGETIRSKRFRHTVIARPGNPDLFQRAGDGSGAAGSGPASGVLGQGPVRPPLPIEDGTLLRASELLNEKQFEAFKWAREGQDGKGLTNDDIAALMDETGEMTAQDVADLLSDVRDKGFIVESLPRKMTLTPDTLRVIVLSARGDGPKDIANEVYPTRDQAKAAGQVRVLRNRHKNLIEQYKAKREGVLAQGPIFYSALKRAVEQSKDKVASAAQWKGLLRNAKGVKQEEIEWTGLFDWLDAQEQRQLNQGMGANIERIAVLSYLTHNGVQVEEVRKRADSEYAMASVQEYEDDETGEPIWSVFYGDGDHQGDYASEEDARVVANEINGQARAEFVTQYESHTLPGGEDYTELLLTLPNIKGPATHWDEENVVAHVRFKTRYIEIPFTDAEKAVIAERRALLDKAEKASGKVAAAGRAIKAAKEPLHEAATQKLLEQARRGEISGPEYERRSLNLWGEIEVPPELQANLDAAWAEQIAAEQAMPAEPIQNRQKVLAIEEVQSDWHQKGREQGYQTPVDPSKAEDARAARRANQQEFMAARADFEASVRNNDAAEYAAYMADKNASGILSYMEMHGISAFDLSEESQAAKAKLDAIRLRGTELDMDILNAEGGKGIPNAPFKNNGWAALVLKRMIRWASENGFDSIAWTPGEVQRERYDLFEHISHVRSYRYFDGDEGSPAQYAVQLGNVSPSVYDQLPGRWVDIPQSGSRYGKAMTAEEMRETLGREVADEVIKQVEEADGEEISVDGRDVRIGGEGMLAFYDRILVNEANKLGKKYGAQVGQTEILIRPGAAVKAPYQDFHSLPITPELKAAALDGLPLFQPGPLTPDEKAFFKGEMQKLPEGETPLDVWNQLSFNEKVRFHEEFARLTEAYFMEGKAPVPKLRRMFEAFARWLKTVYENIADLNVELTPEVRTILDRMYASSEDIAEATRQHALAPLFTVKPEYMTDPEWEEYQLTNANAVDEAEATLRQRSLRDVKWLSNARAKAIKRLQNEAREQRKAVRAEVTTEVMSERVNIARTFLSRGVDSRTGEPVDSTYAGFSGDKLVSGPPKLSIESLELMFPEGSGVNWRKLGYGKYGMLSAGGLHPDALAPTLNYASGEALVRDLVNAEPARDKISGLTDQRMLERYGDLVDDASIARAADEAVHNHLRARVLAGEYAAITNALGERKLILDAAQNAARSLVLRMPAMKLSPAKFNAQERRAGRAAEEALRKNDLPAAAAAKRDQILNFYLAREVYAAQKTRDQALGLFRRMLSAKRDALSKSRNFDLVQAARAVLAAHGMARMQQAPVAYLDAVKRYDPNLYAALEPTILLAMTSGRKLADLTYDQFLGLRDVVDQLWTLSREEKLVEIAGQKVELQQVVNGLNQRLEDLGADAARTITRAPSQAERNLRLFEGAAAAIRRVEAWARHIDGGVVGPFTKFIWRPISQAADAYRADKARLMTAFRALFNPILPTLSTSKIMAPEINYQFRDKAELLHALLHTGNESNQRKLLLGRGWGIEKADGSVDASKWDAFVGRMVREGVLTAVDYQFAQGVWDLLESTKPLAQAAHRRVFGRYFHEITARPLMTPFGEFKGGYVPAIYDAFLSPEAVMHNQQEMVEQNDSTMFPSPAHGFTQSRVEYNKPLELDLRLLAMHIDKVLKFAHMAAPVRDRLRIMNTESFRRLLADLHPTARSDMLNPWLQRSARQITEMAFTGSGGKLANVTLRELRRRSGMGLMFMNIVNTLQQTTGFSLAALHVKKRYLALGLARYIANPVRVRRDINALSPLMASRSDNQAAAMFGEIEAITGMRKGVLGALGNASDWFARHTYFMQSAVQNVLDSIAWQGAYEQAKSAGDIDAEAVAKGDAAIRLTQGTMYAEDISRWEAGNPFWKLFTHMYGYFNMWGNLLSTEFRTAVRELGLKKGAGRLLYVYLVGLTIPTIVAQLIADSLRGRLPEDDEDDGYLDDWLEWFALTNVKTAAAFVPVAGQAGVATVNAFNNAPYDDRVGTSPAVSAVESAVRAPAGIYDLIMGQGDASRTTKDTMGLLTLMSGFPFQALARTVGYAVDVEEGDVNPDGPADYVRGLISGTAGNPN